MALIEANFDTVPDRIQPVGPGVYVLAIREATIGRNKEDNGDVLKLVLEVDDPSNEFHGRKIYETIGLSGMGLTRVKQAARAAGVAFGPKGLDTADFIGKFAKCRVKTTASRDKTTGETREYSNIADYMFEEGK